MSVSSKSDSGSTYWNSQIEGRNRRTRNQTPNYTGYNLISNVHGQRKHRHETENSENISPQQNNQNSFSIDEINEVLSEIDEEDSVNQTYPLIQNVSPNTPRPNSSASEIIGSNIGVIFKAASIWLIEEKFKWRGFYATVMRFFNIDLRFKTNIHYFIGLHDKENRLNTLVAEYGDSCTRQCTKDERLGIFRRAFIQNSHSSSSTFLPTNLFPSPVLIQVPASHTVLATQIPLAVPVPVRRNALPPLPAVPPPAYLISENNFPHQRPIKFVPNRLHHVFTVELVKVLENFISGFNQEKELECSLDLLNFPVKFMWSDDKYRHQIMLSSVHQEFYTVPNSNVVTDPRELKKRFLLRKCRDNIRNNQPGVAADSLKSFVDNREPINDFASKPILLQKMKDLHPQPTQPNLVLPSTWNLDQCQFQFPEKAVCDLIFHLPKLKANGFSSWTFDLITQSIKIDKTKKVSLLFTEVFNLLASGKARHKHLWISSRLLAISKDDPNSIRPIAIGEVFIRVVDKLIALYILGLTDVVSALYPSQCGVGVKGGSEVIAHSISIAYKRIAAVDFECSIISYDTKNAFNTISRKAILDSIMKHCPILAVYYLWLYGESSNLYDGHGNFICQSATGVRQGDPLGPLLFALGIAPILSDLKTQFPDLELFAFLDDIYKVGKTEQCEEAFLVMKQAFGDINLTLNIKKCKHLTKSVQSHAKFVPFLVDDTSELSFYSIPMVSDGISVLKVPIGTPTFVTAASAELVTGYTRIVEFVDRLDPDDAFTLTKLCVNPCPNYLARCVEPTEWESQLMRFDDIIDSSIAKIAGVRRLTAAELTLRHLPTDKGGLGISSYRHIAASAWTASFYSSLPRIESRFQSLYDLVLENKDFYQGFDEKSASLANQKVLSAKANQIIYDNFLASFDVSKRHAKATFLRQHPTVLLIFFIQNLLMVIPL